MTTEESIKILTDLYKLSALLGLQGTEKQALLMGISALENNVANGKDYLRNEIDNFLEHHTISELLKIVYDCVRDRDNEDVAD